MAKYFIINLAVLAFTATSIRFMLTNLNALPFLLVFAVAFFIGFLCVTQCKSVENKKMLFKVDNNTVKYRDYQ